MGGSQSSSGDGTRNVTIETEEGEVDVKVRSQLNSKKTFLLCRTYKMGVATFCVMCM